MTLGPAARRLHVVVLSVEEINEQQDRGNEAFTFSVAKGLLTPGTGRKAIVFTEQFNDSGRRTLAMTHLGRVERGPARTKLDDTWRISQIVELPEPVHLASLLDHLGRNHYRAVRSAAESRRGNGLTDATSRALRAHLEGIIPSHLWNYDSSPTARFEGVEGREVLEEQLDAIGAALTFSGMDRTVLDDAQPQAFSILTSLLPQPPEASLIEHDLRNFPDMGGSPVAEHVYVFTDGRHRLEVINVNATGVETATGVDLIYYNESYDSFVAVQYKRMEDTRGTRVAAVDARLPGQLEKMVKVDALGSGTPGPRDYRLGNVTCFVKFAQSNGAPRAVSDLTKGMYSPAGHLHSLYGAGQLVGPEGGASITHDNLERWLSNTLFSELVKSGWVGSQSVSLDDIKEFVTESLRRKRSVVIAAHVETERLGPGSRG